MTLVEQTVAQAAMLAGALEETQQQLLELFCQSAVTHLTARLQTGLTPDDCRAAFVAAGALYALAALTETDAVSGMQRVQIGDVTLVPGETSAASRCLRRQADMILSPYCVESFLFRGI
jgi:hypothetical protein